MTRTFVRCLVVLGALAVALTLTPLAYAQCSESLPVKHIGVGSKWTGLDDNVPSTLQGRVSFLNTDFNGDGKDDYDNGSANFLCRATAEETAGGQCQLAAGGFGDPDGSVTLNGNWSAGGVNVPTSGCPSVSNDGDAPVCVYVTSMFGGKPRYILGSTGYDATLGLYAFENAQASDVLASHQFPGATILPTSTLPPPTGGSGSVNLEWSPVIKDDDSSLGRPTGVLGLTCLVAYQAFKLDDQDCNNPPAGTRVQDWTPSGSPIDESALHCKVSTGVACLSDADCPVDPATGRSEPCVGTASVPVSATAGRCAYVALGVKVGGVLNPGALVSSPSKADPRDDDRDTVPNAFDNCPTISNLNQADADKDNIGDACDNCRTTVNPDQLDNGDHDCPAPGLLGYSSDPHCGDACDNCRTVPNADQTDSDKDSAGNPAPDGVGDACDNCRDVPNPDQADSDKDSAGNPAPDGVGDACDNCKFVANVDQANSDGDALGDACDNCITLTNPPATDPVSNLQCLGAGVPFPCCTGAGTGNCQADQDADGVGDLCDNCKFVRNQDQSDRDLDGVGDACDPNPDCNPTFGGCAQTCTATIQRAGTCLNTSKVCSNRPSRVCTSDANCPGGICIPKVVICTSNSECPRGTGGQAPQCDIPTCGGNRECSYRVDWDSAHEVTLKHTSSAYRVVFCDTNVDPVYHRVRSDSECTLLPGCTELTTGSCDFCSGGRGSSYSLRVGVDLPNQGNKRVHIVGDNEPESLTCSSLIDMCTATKR